MSTVKVKAHSRRKPGRPIRMQAMDTLLKVDAAMNAWAKSFSVEFWQEEKDILGKAGIGGEQAGRIREAM